MHLDFPVFGLVFSGGGARGAYEIGVAQYLASQNWVPSAYAGASIGALNAVFLAGAPSFQEGVHRLEEVWRTLKIQDIVKMNHQMVVLGLVHAAVKRGIVLHPGLAVYDEAFNLLASKIKVMKDVKNISQLITEHPLLSKLQQGLLDNQFLRRLLEEQLGIHDMENASPIWVSAYPSKGMTRDIVDYLLAGSGIRDTNESHYLQLNEIRKEERLSAILASAAIPGVYSRQTVNGQPYVDGGVGGAVHSRGNTPLTPLVLAGYTHCVVVNLSDGSMFNRHEFKNTTIIEVRPEQTLHRNGLLPSLFDFRPERIQSLISQGYADAKRCIGESLTALSLVRGGRAAAQLKEDRLLELKNDGFDDAMKLLD
ncbi:patatin-like phospholipase family protein [Paenibacillus lemnae]|uniref:PNPLA domain-containing protein n=1 Tax=Paenibacillus lemnae TaxID=1330551 RepID=A0A848M401_PAELE|nr:patatin-like phospholipase family protein [Paenibacillus lemnae]NMO94989.1 hypothetical protein [Paenibacillus lemnae]